MLNNIAEIALCLTMLRIIKGSGIIMYLLNGFVLPQIPLPFSIVKSIRLYAMN